MKKFFLAATGLFAVVPGVGIILKGLGTPPGYALIFGGIIEALGALSLILLYTNRKAIKKLRPARITKTAIWLCIASAVSLLVYIGLFSFCVVGDSIRHYVYYPLWTTGEVAEMINSAGGRYKALQENGFTAVYRGIREMPYYPLAISITSGMLLFFYQAIFTSLAVAFGLIGIHKGEE